MLNMRKLIFQQNYIKNKSIKKLIKFNSLNINYQKYNNELLNFRYSQIKYKSKNLSKISYKN
jgi:hypothetical protein